MYICLSQFFSIATADVDFQSTSVELVIQPTMSSGTLTESFNISIIDDTILEFEEDFRVMFDTSSPDPEGVMFNMTSSSTIITIVDDGKK